MPLDTGRIAALDVSGETHISPTIEAILSPTLDDGPDIGSALKAVREHLGRSLEDVAEDTRIRRAYLAALEEGRLEALPSRPFTIGYVRAYAKALGLDGEAAVERFRREEPAPDQALRAPLGVQGEGRDPRVALVAMALAAVVGAIVLFNVAQRLMDQRPGPSPVVAAPVAVAPAKPAPAAQPAAVALGAPLPPPLESTTPPPYETPGLAAAVDGSADAAEAAMKARKAAEAQAPIPAAPSEALPATFVAQGAVYGGPAESSPVVLQARKPASLIVRGADGSVYFARQLAAGEAYRAPALPGLTVDVSEPQAFQVFVAGQTKGLLATPQTPVSKLAN